MTDKSNKTNSEPEFALVSRPKRGETAPLEFNFNAAEHSLNCASVLVRLVSMMSIDEIRQRSDADFQSDMFYFGEIVTDLIEDAQHHYERLQVHLAERLGENKQ